MQGRDLLACAQTGTGKTAAFALPIIERLLNNTDENTAAHRGRPVISALILAPTRELAAQIGESFGQFEKGTALRHAVIFGGVPKGAQVQALRRGIDILVATPGRLIDLMQQGEVHLGHVRTFVLDEADRMLDMGFIHDVKRVIAKLPQKRQTLLLSATMPREIETLAARIMVNPVRVEVDRVSSIGAPIAQSVYFVDPQSKMRLLTTLLQGDAIDRALVFTRTKRGANRVAEDLVRAGFRAAAIHGNKSQSARERALSGFKSGEIRIVVSTDLASRGIDIKDLSHVINFDLPQDPESYVHRIGRTGRAGQSGIAMSFCTPQERPDLQAIERLARLRIDQVALPQLVAAAQGQSRESSQQSRGPSQQSRGSNQQSRGSNQQPRFAQSSSSQPEQSRPDERRAQAPGAGRPPTRGRRFTPSRSSSLRG